MIPTGRRIVAVPLDAEAWAPFGWIPVADTDPSDGMSRLVFASGDPHLNVISHGPEEVPRAAEAGYTDLEGRSHVATMVFRCEGMYRHITHTQALLVLDNPSVIAVASPGIAFGSPEAEASIRAFVVQSRDFFVLSAGTWHWGPFPLGDNPVNLYNLQGFGYRDDNEFVGLDGMGIEVSVETSRWGIDPELW